MTRTSRRWSRKSKHRFWSLQYLWH